MNEHLRDRIHRKLDTLSEERAYQVLDYVEFLASKYAERPAPVATNVFTRFTEAVEDRLRAGKVSSSAIAETMGLMNRAVKVLDGMTAAGRSVATDLAGAASTAFSTGSGAAGAPSAPADGEPPVPPTSPGSGRVDSPNATDSGEVNPPGVAPAVDGPNGTPSGIHDTTSGRRA